MKKIMYLSLLLFSVTILPAQELIKNGDFTENIIDEVTNPAKAMRGEWFVVNNEAEGVVSINYFEDENNFEHATGMRISNEEGKGKLSWYKVFLGQRISDSLEEGIYRLSFEAKGERKNTEIGMYIKQTAEEAGKDPATGKNYNTFFVRKAYDIDDEDSKKQSGAAYIRKIGTKWTKVYVDFDMSKVINNYNSKSAVAGLAISDSNEAILNDCYIAIQALRKGDTVSIDNVVLKKIK